MKNIIITCLKMNNCNFFKYKCNLMNKSVFEKICFDTFFNILPAELIYEVIDKVPKCNRCKLFPKTEMSKCFICRKSVCDKCLKNCHDCLSKVCNKCSSDLYRIFDIYTICDSCDDNPKCITCQDYATERCIDCYKPICNYCGLTCCSDTSMICQDCVEDSSEMYMCDCDNNIICSNCSYTCKYCERKICGECKDLSVAYNGKKMCLECRQD